MKKEDQREIYADVLERLIEHQKRKDKYQKEASKEQLDAFEKNKN